MRSPPSSFSIVALTRPFCSKRCADLDLNQWFKGGYAIPGPPADPNPSNPSENDPEED